MNLKVAWIKLMWLTLEELVKMLLADSPYSTSQVAQEILKHSAIMKLVPLGIGCKCKFLSDKAEELHADKLRSHVSMIRFGNLNHRLFEPTVRHDLSFSNIIPWHLIALSKTTLGKAFWLVFLSEEETSCIDIVDCIWLIVMLPSKSSATFASPVVHYWSRRLDSNSQFCSENFWNMLDADSSNYPRLPLLQDVKFSCKMIPEDYWWQQIYNGMSSEWSGRLKNSIDEPVGTNGRWRCPILAGYDGSRKGRCLKMLLLKRRNY